MYITAFGEPADLHALDSSVDLLAVDVDRDEEAFVLRIDRCYILDSGLIGSHSSLRLLVVRIDRFSLLLFTLVCCFSGLIKRGFLGHRGVSIITGGIVIEAPLSRVAG